MAKRKVLCSWDGVPDPAHSIWTQGNVNEVTPGVTKPLAADIAMWWDYYWCKAVIEQMHGVGKVHIAEPPHFNQLGYCGGRWTISVSFNLELSSCWAMGGTSTLQSYFEGGDAIVAAAGGTDAATAQGNAVINQKWRDIVKLRRDGDRKSRGALNAMRRLKLHTQSDADLVGLIDQTLKLEGELFEAHYYVSVGGGDFASHLGAALDRYAKRHPPEWVTMLTSGLRDVESSRPGKAIWDLSRIVVGRPSLANEFSTLTGQQVIVRLAAPPTPDWEEFSGAFRAFIDEFGWRGQRESDPATPTWDESPEFVIGAIRSELHAPASSNPYTREERAARARERLEQRVLKRVPAKERAAFRRTLKLAQTLARERENIKANWARLGRVYRRPALELGRRLAERGIIEKQDDVWFLRWTELQQVPEGKLSARTAKAAVTNRRAEFEKLGHLVGPDGVFDWPDELISLDVEPGADNGAKSFKALAISPGIAEGRARVILDAYDDAHIEPGEILVAPVTDAPWTPLFIPAAGVVVEVGGVLSHAATVAREFGIPGVSGVKNATQLIKTGQLVRVDGNTGTVTILSR
jgi:rifampicin phosphotransferase